MDDFDFEKLRVYQKALDFAEMSFKIANKLPARLQSSLGDQFRRAAISVVNNIAEGSNKNSKKEKVQFYRYSLNSARECAPMLTLCHRLDHLDKQLYEDLREENIAISKMLSKLINAL